MFSSIREYELLVQAANYGAGPDAPHSPVARKLLERVYERMLEAPPDDRATFNGRQASAPVGAEAARAPGT